MTKDNDTVEKSRPLKRLIGMAEERSWNYSHSGESSLVNKRRIRVGSTKRLGLHRIAGSGWHILDFVLSYSFIGTAKCGKAEGKRATAIFLMYQRSKVSS